MTANTRQKQPKMLETKMKPLRFLHFGGINFIGTFTQHIITMSSYGRPSGVDFWKTNSEVRNNIWDPFHKIYPHSSHFMCEYYIYYYIFIYNIYYFTRYSQLLNGHYSSTIVWEPAIRGHYILSYNPPSNSRTKLCLKYYRHSLIMK